MYSGDFNKNQYCLSDCKMLCLKLFIKKNCSTCSAASLSKFPVQCRNADFIFSKVQQTTAMVLVYTLVWQISPNASRVAFTESRHLHKHSSLPTIWTSSNRRGFVQLSYRNMIRLTATPAPCPPAINDFLMLPEDCQIARFLASNF